MLLSPRQVKVRRAFLIAPLLGPVVLALGLGVASMFERASSPEFAIEIAALFALPFLFLGFPFVYAFGLLVGVPFYWFLKRHGRLQLMPILAISGVLGPIALIAGTAFWTGEVPRILVVLAVPAGMAVGLTFWLLGVRGVTDDSVA